MLLLIDNYDSFTYNLCITSARLGPMSSRRNDALDVQEAMGLNLAAIVLSPGPCDPGSGGHLVWR
jgi:anthranilate synthase component 2